MGASLLILDDEPLNLEIIGEYLSDSGYQLSFFDDPEVAWSELDANPRKFDVIVMDRMMPKIDMQGMGFYAYVTDPEGTVLGLWEDAPKK
jgi:CheY-like chemotaxis protein